jgi:hypothetical protein
MQYLDAIAFTILIIALIEVAIRTPPKADAISFVICMAAFVNLSNGPSELSYSMHLTIDPTAIIFFPIRPSFDARPVSLINFPVSLVDSSVCRCVDSVAMLKIIKKLALVFVSISANA